MRTGSERFDHVFVAGAAGLEVFRLRRRVGGRPQSDDGSNHGQEGNRRGGDSGLLSLCCGWQLQPPLSIYRSAKERRRLSRPRFKREGSRAVPAALPSNLSISALNLRNI